MVKNIMLKPLIVRMGGNLRLRKIIIDIIQDIFAMYNFSLEQVAFW